jgi:CBS domain-containing protein
MLTAEVATMKVREVMTREVVSCQKVTDVGTAGRLMLQGRFGAIPVVDEHGRVAGVITDRDIAIAVATRQRNASHIGVHEAMSPKVRSCFTGDDVSAALRQMEEAHVRRLPVLDEKSHLAGILSIDDIVARALDQKDGISTAEFAQAFRRICSQSAKDSEIDASETTR